MLKKVLLFILRVLGLYKEDNITPTLATKEQTIYELKPFMTAYERKMPHMIHIRGNKEIKKLT